MRQTSQYRGAGVRSHGNIGRLAHRAMDSERILRYVSGAGRVGVEEEFIRAARTKCPFGDRRSPDASEGRSAIGQASERRHCNFPTGDLQLVV
ncbi:MAG: hypothetical protein ACTHON_18905, partial [Humibacter sp.]